MSLDDRLKDLVPVIAQTITEGDVVKGVLGPEETPPEPGVWLRRGAGSAIIAGVLDHDEVPPYPGIWLRRPAP